ncbi:CENP-B/ARS binding protein-like protein, partial [Fomitiporia mediterranea MF3/22]
IKSIRRHGEAASVDQAQVAEERVRITKILSQYKPEDQYNFDETGLFAYAPPDRGLALRQMSGRKANRFRITIGLCCNADGSDKRDLFIIGKSRKPRCFNSQSPTTKGFYYRANQSAWMTSFLFQEWLQNFDLAMQREGRYVILLLDNFSAHRVPYQPTHIHLEFFAPNMTPFIQPLDAGIIRTFKALYRRAFCKRAVDLDEAGERDIYKINLLEAMLMTNSAWDRVDASTIRNCWKHSGLQRYALFFVVFLLC